MKIAALSTIINHAFQFVIKTSHEYNIDESHSLKHSMEVFHLADKILCDEIKRTPYLTIHKPVIFASAILHDMCDKKYMNEMTGVKKIREYMEPYMTPRDLEVTSQIISTMSYSKVKKYGYPDLGEHQMAYHIVREADLLAAYDIDRCIIYGMCVENLSYTEAVKRSKTLFRDRVLNYRSDQLFVTPISKLLSLKLHIKAIDELDRIRDFSDIF
jgi:HD superfamily phosphodiesterase